MKQITISVETGGNWASRRCKPSQWAATRAATRTDGRHARAHASADHLATSKSPHRKKKIKNRTTAATGQRDRQQPQYTNRQTDRHAQSGPRKPPVRAATKAVASASASASASKDSPVRYLATPSGAPPPHPPVPSLLPGRKAHALDPANFPTHHNVNPHRAPPPLRTSLPHVPFPLPPPLDTIAAGHPTSSGTHHQRNGGRKFIDHRTSCPKLNESTKSRPPRSQNLSIFFFSRVDVSTVFPRLRDHFNDKPPTRCDSGTIPSKPSRWQMERSSD